MGGDECAWNWGQRNTEQRNMSRLTRHISHITSQTSHVTFKPRVCFSGRLAITQTRGGGRRFVVAAAAHERNELL